MFWQNKATFTLFQEVNMIDIITFKVDITVFWTEKWFQMWTHPCNKLGRLILHKMNIFVRLFMDEQ